MIIALAIGYLVLLTLVLAFNHGAHMNDEDDE